MSSIKFWLISHRRHLLVLLLYGIIAIALMGPMASSSVIFSTGETGPHLGYLIQAKMALEEGQFPLRIAPIENNGWRYAAFQFYSQIPYTLGALIYKFITPENPYTAYKIMLWCSLTIGGFFIYNLSLWLTRRQIPGILAGVSYMSAPYFLNTIHARGAFPESIAQGILPIVIYYVIRCYNSSKPRYILLSSLAWFALATTHIITFVYGSLFIGLWGFLLIIKTSFLGQIDRQSYKLSLVIKTLHFPVLRSKLIRISCSYILSWLLGLYFLIPVVFESTTLSMRVQLNTINPYVTNWMSPLANLLSPTALSPLPTPTGDSPTYGLNPAVGWIFLAAWGVVFYYYYFRQKLPPRLQVTRPYILGLLWIFILVLFITWSPIDFWSFLPKTFWVTQFTFRFLTHIMWTGALLTGYAVVILFRQKLESKHLIIGILIIILASSPWLPNPRGTLTVDEVLKSPLFRYSGALDYLNRSPLKALYGNAQMPLLPNSWIPGGDAWDAFNTRPLLIIPENDNNWQTWPLWQPGENPILVLEGRVFQDRLAGPTILSVLSNGKLIAEISLNQPQISWSIPFKDAKTDEKSFNIQFIYKGITQNGQRPRVEVDNLYFQGISPTNTVIPLKFTKDKCDLYGMETLCKISVNETAQVVQLPVLYYPNMQRVEVNGKKVPYFATNYHDYNVVGIRLKPDTYEIKVIFIGLAWANWISFVAWITLITISAFRLYQSKLKLKQIL
ncbi:hypothetical protein [Aphanothece sacrum]|uniref:Membrane protein n=1 Tax=Aphanothece sacrum FPU1 TaxID=1920663 RepID=A0A401IM20_APHSA|nr:hypothetical protein [Aphanothece sacrum]GBF82283.1 membrane protein [Aphanothece sacrum FPU1]GBF84184.1 membrane protein [Aphanothece sacrum FPU3]